ATWGEEKDRGSGSDDCDRICELTDARKSGHTYIAFRCWKQSLQYTGRPCVGRKGTVVSFPHCEHVAVVSTRSRGEWLTRLLRLVLQSLHRLGSFLKFLSA